MVSENMLIYHQGLIVFKGKFDCQVKSVIYTYIIKQCVSPSIKLSYQNDCVLETGYAEPDLRACEPLGQFKRELRGYEILMHDRNM